MKLGIDPIKAWDYTPCEIGLMCDQFIEKKKKNVDELLFIAWHTEAFARQKRLPSFERIIKDAHRPKDNAISDAILKAMAKEKGVIIE